MNKTDLILFTEGSNWVESLLVWRNKISIPTPVARTEYLEYENVLQGAFSSTPKNLMQTLLCQVRDAYATFAIFPATNYLSKE